MWGAESIAQILFNKVREGVVDNVKRFPRYTCVQTIVRSQFQLPTAGSSCATAIANSERNADAAILRWHDRLRLDVAVGEKSEMFSWAGASKFESGDMTQLIAKGASGSGEFGSFLASVFGGDGEGFVYKGLQDTPIGRVASFDFIVPLAKSHYQYSAGKAYRTVGYHGSFWVDPDNADLRELDLEATGFPAEDHVCRVADKIEYARTQIGQNSFMLPKKSSMDVIYTNSTESLNEASFAGCREYTGESTIRFDVDENGNLPESAKQAELRPLPPKTHLRVRINPPIDTAKAAAGDPITGVVDLAVKEKGEVVVHVGDKLHGRIVRLEQTMSAVPRWTVAILFETIERNGIEQKVALKAMDDGDRSPSGRGRDRRAQRYIPGVIGGQRDYVGAACRVEESFRSASRGILCWGRSSSPSGRRGNRQQFGGCEFAPVADFQISECHWPDVRADQLQDLASHGLDHAAHLAIAAFGDA